MTSAFYRRQPDGSFAPLVPATGSWNRNHQNGSAVAGLLAFLIETTPTRTPLRIARLTVDIMRPVPFQPITTHVDLLRDGARMQLVDAALLADGEVVARASAMRVRMAESPAAPDLVPDVPTPEDTTAVPITSALDRGHPMETRLARGSSREIGPGAAWVTFNADLVEGIPITPFQRATMAADIASAPSSVVTRGEWSFANLDLSLHCTRPPAGDWILIDAQTISAGVGVGLVNTVLADRSGAFGRGHQAVFHAPMRQPG